MAFLKSGIYLVTFYAKVAQVVEVLILCLDVTSSPHDCVSVVFNPVVAHMVNVLFFDGSKSNFAKTIHFCDFKSDSSFQLIQRDIEKDHGIL